VFLTAFANHWHNGMFWDLGWNSQLSIRNDNPNPPSVDVEIVYVTDYGNLGGPGSWNPDNACFQSTLSDRLTLTIPPLASQSTSLNLILGSNWLHTVQEDGFFYFVPPANVFPLGTYSVTPNASARAEHCGADSCPQTVCN